MSGQVVPAGQTIVAGNNQIALSPVFVPCTGIQCQLWVEGECSQRGLNSFVALKSQGALREVLGNLAVGLVDVADGLGKLAPPESGPSPVSRVAIQLDGIGKQLERIVEIYKSRSGGK